MKRREERGIMKIHGKTQSEYEREYAERLHRSLTELAQKAWEAGIIIVSVRLENNWVEDLSNFPLHGDKMVIKAPKITKICTDFMDIEVLEKQSQKEE